MVSSVPKYHRIRDEELRQTGLRRLEGVTSRETECVARTRKS
jgi:hypothetical protein